MVTIISQLRNRSVLLRAFFIGNPQSVQSLSFHVYMYSTKHEMFRYQQQIHL